MTTAHNLDVDKHENKQNGCQTHSNSYFIVLIKSGTQVSHIDLCCWPTTLPHPLPLLSFTLLHPPTLSHPSTPFAPFLTVGKPCKRSFWCCWPTTPSYLHHNAPHFIHRHPVETQVSKLCQLRFLTHHSLPCPLPLNHTVVPAHPLHPLTPCPAASCDSLSKPSIWAPVTDNPK